MTSEVREAETVPCKYCGDPTRMTGTKLCDGCWELSTRLQGADAETLSAIIEDVRPALATPEREPEGYREKGTLANSLWRLSDPRRPGDSQARRTHSP